VAAFLRAVPEASEEVTAAEDDAGRDTEELHCG